MGWKDLEGTNVKVIPATALISDTKLQNKTNLPDEPTLRVMISAWSEAIRICGLEMPLKSLDSAYMTQTLP